MLQNKKIPLIEPLPLDLNDSSSESEDDFDLNQKMKN